MTPDAPRAPAPRPSALRYVSPAVVYVAYIFVMGSLRGVETPMHVSDKTAHFVAFGLMVPLLERALRYFQPLMPRMPRLMSAAALSSGAGALLEVWQSFLPYRSSELLDWIADTVGAVLALAITALAWRIARTEGGTSDGSG